MNCRVCGNEDFTSPCVVCRSQMAKENDPLDWTNLGTQVRDSEQRPIGDEMKCMICGKQGDSDLCTDCCSQVTEASVKCIMPGCNELQIDEYEHCKEHLDLCTRSGCNNPHRFGGTICKEHYDQPPAYCSFEECKEICVQGARFCDQHTGTKVQSCVIPECLGSRVDGEYCDEHIGIICLHEECTTESKKGWTMCIEHGGQEPEPVDNICKHEGCGLSREGSYIYCQEHLRLSVLKDIETTCVASRCNGRKIQGSQFCILHNNRGTTAERTCQWKDASVQCEELQSSSSGYCSKHMIEYEVTCEIENCKEPCVDKYRYCDKHLAASVRRPADCSQEGCNEQRAPGYRFCDHHCICAWEGCDNLIAQNSVYCYGHIAESIKPTPREPDPRCSWYNDDDERCSELRIAKGSDHCAEHMMEHELNKTLTKNDQKITSICFENGEGYLIRDCEGNVDSITAYSEDDGSLWFRIIDLGEILARLNGRHIASVKYAEASDQDLEEE